MDYNEYVEKLLEVTQEQTQKVASSKFEVTKGSITKLNDTKLDCLTFCDTESNPKVAQNIYINEYYDEGITEEDIEKIAQRIVFSVMNNEVAHAINVNEWIFENAKDYIIPMLINPTLNREFLTNLPHRPFLNLAIIYIVDKEDMNMKVYTSNMELWGITEEELFNIAMDNLERKAKEAIKVPEKIPQPGDKSNSKDSDIFVGDIMDTHELMMLGMLVDESPKYTAFDLINLLKNPNRKNKREGLFITNYRKLFMAQMCLSQNLMNHIAELIDSSFYFVMNSFHEIVIKKETEPIGSDLSLPDEIIELRDLCREVYLNCTSESERLSDCVYHYNRETNEIRMV